MSYRLVVARVSVLGAIVALAEPRMVNRLQIIQPRLWQMRFVGLVSEFLEKLSMMRPIVFANG